MQQTEKILRIRNQHGKMLQIVREHYVREDVPCHSNLCLAGCGKEGFQSVPVLLSLLYLNFVLLVIMITYCGARVVQ